MNILWSNNRSTTGWGIIIAVKVEADKNFSSNWTSGFWRQKLYTITNPFERTVWTSSKNIEIDAKTNFEIIQYLHLPLRIGIIISH